MAWEDEIVGPDVASAGLHLSECIRKEVTGQVDLEEALASRYSSHPYSSHPKEEIRKAITARALAGCSDTIA